MTIEIVRGDRLSAAQVYEVWRLRDAVFAYEQHVDDVDVDGLDLLPTTTHLWLADDAGLTSYLRVLEHADPVAVGRVCTRKDVRGRGLSGTLLREAIARWGDRPLHLGAQKYLERWYAGFGFAVSGDEYDDGGIPHVPMDRPAS